MLDRAQHTSITVKFSGDGTNIAASATIVFLTFSFPGLEENVLSAAGKQEMYMYSNAVHVECTCICMQPYTPGNHTFASVKGPEEYEFLNISFQPVWKQLGDLIADPFVYVEGKEIHLKIVFGSDYKVCFRTFNCSISIYIFKYIQFLATMTGLNKANSTYACVWCTVTKDER